MLGGGGQGGGIAGGNGSLLNTIVAQNTGAAPDAAGSFTSLGHNLIGITNGGSGFVGPGDLVGTSALPLNPGLGPLADNGGGTLTMALLPMSCALNAGVEFEVSSQDQRGVIRPQGTGVDMGACEYEFVAPVFTAATLRNGAALEFEISGPPNQSYTLEQHTAAAGWADWVQLTSGEAGVCCYTNPIVSDGLLRLFRVKWLRP